MYKKNKYQNKNYENLKKVSEDIKMIFGEDVAKNLSNLRFYYEGFHNQTYIGKYEDLWVQVRVPKKVVDVDYFNEMAITKTFKDYLFVKDGYIIKKWFPGQDLFKITMDEKVKFSLFNCIQNFQELSVSLKPFNWNLYNINDPKYLELLEKYKNEPLVVSHNNLKRHNVLINKYGFLKLIDFEFCAMNFKYVDPVCLHIFFKIDKEEIINFFNLDLEKFEDYIYLVQTFSKALYDNTYSKLDLPQSKITDSFLQFQDRDYSISNKFIIQKFRNQFDNRLDIKEIENFYFVPICVYEDNDKIIWRWLNCNSVYFFNQKQLKALANALRICHDSPAKFPSYILEEKIEWYLGKINHTELYSEIGSKDNVYKILKWVKELKPDANCHNNLSLDNVFFSDENNVYIIDWSVAYYNNRFLDIAYLFESVGLSYEAENYFWKSYGISKPKDFNKYRIISNFTAYLYNKTLNGDYGLANINMKRIIDLLKLEEK